jgi:DNA-binding LytR/AlgR family response regulator
MHCLIVDDEPVARDILKQYIQDTPDLVLAGECESALTAMSFLKEQRVDLIFLDINMPKLSGISFLKSLKHPPKVILTTAYSEYALEGYELDVIDYLLKPFSFERFLKAVTKASALMEEKEPVIVIKADGKSYRIKERDILFIESMGDYITLHTSDQKLTFNQTLKSFVQELSSDSFIRVHKSYVISMAHIDYVEGNIIHIKDREVPVGKSFKAEFQERFLN